MTAEQEAAWQEINDSWPIRTSRVEPDGTVYVLCEDTDEAVIEEDGEWFWR